VHGIFRWFSLIFFATISQVSKKSKKKKLFVAHRELDTNLSLVFHKSFVCGLITLSALLVEHKKWKILLQIQGVSVTTLGGRFGHNAVLP
jgi:hypothetical protein